MTLEAEYVHSYDKLLKIAAKQCVGAWSFEPEDVMQELYFEVRKIHTEVKNNMWYLIRMLRSVIGNMTRMRIDVPMEDTDNIEVAEQIQSDPKWICVMTGLSMLAVKRQS